ncbi:hypothetical protein ACXIZN_09350 [Amycolatopsis sp. TRM77291]
MILNKAMSLIVVITALPGSAGGRVIAEAVAWNHLGEVGTVSLPTIVLLPLSAIKVWRHD